MSKLDRFLNDSSDYDEVKEFLRERYLEIKSTYRYYSSLGDHDTIFSIRVNVLNDLLNHMGAIDFKYLTLANVGIDVTATDTSSMKFKNNPQGQIVRHEFLELLPRLAKTKLMSSGEVQNISIAIKRFYSEYCEKFFTKYDLCKFRANGYWCEEVDFLYHKNIYLMKSLYGKYSGAKTLPGNKKFMSLSEFREFVLVGNFGDKIKERDINLCYNLSQMTCIDELNTNKCYELIFVEFLEAFARMAEIVAIDTKVTHQLMQPRVNMRLTKRSLSRLKGYSGIIGNKPRT